MAAFDMDEALDQFDAALVATPDDDEDFGDELVLVSEMDLATYEAFLAKRAATPYGKLMVRLRHLLVPTLIDAYRSARDDERERVLAVFARHRFVQIAIWALIIEDTWRLQKAFIPDKLRLARQVLQLAVLTDDLGLVEPGRILTGVWSGLDAAGIDPRQVFLEAADLASDRPLPHGPSARDVLREFEPFDYGNPTRQP